jgi:hypothetical protein
MTGLLQNFVYILVESLTVKSISFPLLCLASFFFLLPLHLIPAQLVTQTNVVVDPFDKVASPEVCWSSPFSSL